MAAPTAGEAPIGAVEASPGAPLLAGELSSNVGLPGSYRCRECPSALHSVDRCPVLLDRLELQAGIEAERRSSLRR